MGVQLVYGVEERQGEEVDCCWWGLRGRREGEVDNAWRVASWKHSVGVGHLCFGVVVLIPQSLYPIVRVHTHFHINYINIFSLNWLIYKLSKTTYTRFHLDI